MAHATTIAIAPSQDVTLRGTALVDTTVFDSIGGIIWANANYNNDDRAALSFSLSDIPADSEIVLAVLHLFVVQGGGNTGDVGNFELDGFAAFGPITVDSYGANSVLTGFTDTVGQFPEKAFDVTSLVGFSHWLAPNVEFHVKALSDNILDGFASMENAVSEWRPYLEVMYANASHPASEPPPVAVLQWGAEGSGDGQFHGPLGLAVNSHGDVYVADQGNCRIQKFTSNGTFLLAWGTQGSGAGHFQSPYGIAVDAMDNVYATDLYGVVQKFSSEGVYLGQIGATGSGDGQYAIPDGVTVDQAGNVYVADAGGRKILKFDDAGEFVTQWGSRGSGVGQVDSYCSLACDVDGNVYVSDYGNRRVQEFDENGTFLMKWGAFGFGEGQFYYVNGIAVDAAQNVYVASLGSGSPDRVQKFTRGGEFLASWSGSDVEDGAFKVPAGLAVDQNGDVFVADYLNNRIQKFTYASGTRAPGVRDAPDADSSSDIDLFVQAVGREIRASGRIPAGTRSTLEIFDISGRRLDRLSRDDAHGEMFSYRWPNPRRAALRTSAGVYIAVLKVGEVRITRRFVLAK